VRICFACARNAPDRAAAGRSAQTLDDGDANCQARVDLGNYPRCDDYGSGGFGTMGFHPN